MTDAYSEGWRARPLDGSVQQEYAVVPADGALRAIALEAGAHRLRIEYAPPIVTAGLRISLAAALLFAGVSAWAGLAALRRAPAESTPDGTRASAPGR